MRRTDVPSALQVFWKFLTLVMAACAAYAAYSCTDIFGQVVLTILSFAWFLIGLFTVLGE